MSNFLHRVGIMKRSPSPVFPMASITQVGASSSTAETITAPAGIVFGDILVLLQYSDGFFTLPTAVVPTGFVNVVNSTDTGRRTIASVKIADGTEAGATLTGMNATGFGTTNAKAMEVFRGDAAAVQLETKGALGAVIDGNPVAQVQTIASETAPLIVIGGYGAGAAISPRTWTPGPVQGEVNPNTTLYLAYQIFNSSPANTTIDMDDEGSGNGLQSFTLIPYKV